MTARGASGSLLALLFVAMIWAPVLAESHESPGEFEDAFRFSQGGQLISEGDAGDSPTDADRQWMTLVEKELDAAKQELLELEGVRQAALVLYSDPDEVCEREVIERWYQEERARLKSNVSALRGIRGDRRGFFTKAWHRIGPVGRRIVRAIGDEALETLKSGGTLGGGVARRIVIRVGRKQLKNVVLAGIARKIEARAAAAKGAAEEECKKDDLGTVPNAPVEPTGQGAIPPATYEGAFDETLLTDLISMDEGRPDINTIRFSVGEDGLVSGEVTIYDEGVFLGCPGAVDDWSGTVAPNQRIGSELPHVVTVTMTYVGYESADDRECFIQPVPYSQTSPLEFRIDRAADGVIAGVILDYLPFELQQVAEE